MPNIFADLNPAQKEAVESTNGPIRVLAVPGAGKTKALAHRYANLVLRLGVLPRHILCITFTNKAAGEMRKRIRKLTGDNDVGYISTFHGFCVTILHEDIHALSYPQEFRVLDEDDVEHLLQNIYTENNYNMQYCTIAKAKELLTKWKGNPNNDYAKYFFDYTTDEVKTLYDNAKSMDEKIIFGFLYYQKKEYAFDFQDLIEVTLLLFSIRNDILEKWQKRLEYIMVDEFQDIDYKQYILVEKLSDYHKNLFIVGDPDQTIYTWRGANIKYILEFDTFHPHTKDIVMDLNYRSTPQIINVANSLISNNVFRAKKTIVPVLDDGQNVIVHCAKNTDAESFWIASKIEELHNQGVEYNQIVILYRAHYLSRPVEKSLVAKKIPYVIYSGVRFFARKEIKTAVSYLNFIAYKDDLSFENIINVPKRNIGKKRMEFLKEYAKDHDCSLYEALLDNLSDKKFTSTKAKEFVALTDKYSSCYKDYFITDLLAKLMEDSGYENSLLVNGDQDRLDNLAEFKQCVADYEAVQEETFTLEDYLKDVALFTSMELDEKISKVKMMTIHSTKGLEFPYVFLCGMNEGIFPTRKADSQKKLEEERRLAFVAMTRAEKGLYLSEAEGYNHDGSVRHPSIFLMDINQDLLEFDPEPSEEYKKYVRCYSRPNYVNTITDGEGQFKVDDRIEHVAFGPGTIVDVNTKEDCYVIDFDNLATPRDISFSCSVLKPLETKV